MFLFCATLLLALLVYGLVKDQTIGSICRNSGRSIRQVASIGIDPDGNEWAVTTSARSSIRGTGRWLEDACSGRWD